MRISEDNQIKLGDAQKEMLSPPRRGVLAELRREISARLCVSAVKKSFSITISSLPKVD